jgi:hypothetical protein
LLHAKENSHFIGVRQRREPAAPARLAGERGMHQGFGGFHVDSSTNARGKKGADGLDVKHRTHCTTNRVAAEHLLDHEFVRNLAMN